MRIAEIFRSLQGEGRLTGVESIFVRVAGCNLRCRYCDTPYASWTPEGEELSVSQVLDRIEQLRQSPRPAFLEELTRASRRVWGEGQQVRIDQPPATPHLESPNHQISKSPNPNLSPLHHVVLTGGEPMLFPDLVALTAQLRDRGWHITIETAGTIYLPVACDLMSISPKLANSTPAVGEHPQWARHHADRRHAPEAVRRLIAEYDCQWKFVIDTPDDCEEVLAYLAAFPEIDRTSVMLMPQGIEAAALAEKAAWLEPYCMTNGFAFCPRRQVEWFGAQRGR
jgi:7-carboxy-7-deazaguanine synthase